MEIAQPQQFRGPAAVAGPEGPFLNRTMMRRATLSRITGKMLGGIRDVATG
jgi:hypothetical protein